MTSEITRAGVQSFGEKFSLRIHQRLLNKNCEICDFCNSYRVTD